MKKVSKRIVAVSVLLSLISLVVVFADLSAARSATGPVPSADAVVAFAQQGKLTASDGVTGNFLGFNVAISGDTAIAGAPRNPVNGNPNRGAAYVYLRTGATWTQQQKLSSSDGVANDQFGYSVAVFGDTAAVGMLNDQDLLGTRSRGFVYIFQRTGAVWAQTQILTPNDHAAGDSFGSSLAFENDTLVIGARSKTNGSTLFVGAAYVFTRPAGGAFTQQSKLSPGDIVLGEFFGHSVGLSGDTAIVGAVGLAGFSNPNGKAYVFTRSGSSWTLQQKLVAADAASGDAFGFSVAVSGDTAIAGAVRRVTNPGINSGAAYVFQRSGATWTQQQRIVHSDPEINDEFGYYVALKNETAVVSARSYETPPNTAVNHGAVFVFTRSGANWTQTERLIHGDVGPDGLGTSVAYDGTSIIAGASNKTDGTGAAYVFASDGSPSPTPTPTPTPANSIQFSAPTFAVTEGPAGSAPSGYTSGEVNSWEAAAVAGQGAAVVSVTRTGDTSGAASVDYATQDGTASSRSDYSAAYGTLRFAAGETSKTIVVFITDDRFQETPETFSLVLTTPVGATLSAPTTTTGTVTSDDVVTGTNPVKDATFDSDFFVRQHYADFLGREADAPGLSFWKQQIDECETRPAAERQPCREIRRINVSAAFFLSIEFQQTGYFVYLFHQAAFNSQEQLQLARFLADVGEVRRGVVVGQANWEQTLEANKQAYALVFVAQQAFLSAYPSSMTPAQFVDALSANTSGSISQSERNTLVAELTANNTSAGRASVLRKISDDSGFRAFQTNRAFVLMQYFGYLRRTPNDVPDLDFSGYNFWLAKLNQFNGNFVEAEMVKAFIMATEYQQRFGP